MQLVENPKDIDWDNLLAFLQYAFAYMDERIDPPSSLHRMSSETLKKKSQEETLVTVDLDGLLGGCMFCRKDSDWLYIGKVAVHPDHQRKGIGKALFVRAFEIARRDGFKGLELETRVELVENQRTFEKLGFVKVGESAHDGYENATSITMRASLQPLTLV